MTNALISVTFAGPQVSVQDSGRPGLLRYGVPGSGPMDRLAFGAANLALGNDASAAGVEISLGGVTLHCQSGAVSYALAGGGFLLDHSGRTSGAWQIATLRAGETLQIRPGHWGSWAYLAFAGDLNCARWLGSASTHLVSNLGGGRLSRGTLLEIHNPRIHPQEGAFPCPVLARPRSDIRVTMGPQQRFFDRETLGDFMQGPWQITAAGDRMGMRLAGPAIAPNASLDMPSEPIPRGAIQVAGDGVATVLLADHQTTGGYPKIATVLDCDLDGFVQLRPKDRLRFHPVTALTASSAARSYALAKDRYFQALIRGRPPIPA